MTYGLQESKEWHSNILIYLLIAFSGIPFFLNNQFLLPIFFIYLLVLSLSKSQGKIFTRTSLHYITIIVIIYTLQGLFNESLNLNTYGVITIKYGIALLVLFLLRHKFIEIYIKVMYFIAIVSLPFYVLFYFSTPAASFFINNICPLFEQSSRNEFYHAAPSFILYTLNVLSRNAGPFWEPGGYGIFLMIAIVFNYLLYGKILNKYGVVFIVSVITTFSTGTYFILFGFLLIIFSKKDIKSVWFIIPFVVLSVFLYNKIDFLGKKIEARIEIVKYGESNYRAINRLSSIVLDLEIIKIHPLLGYDKRAIQDSFEYRMHRNNGISSMAARMGLPYFIIYLSLLYYSVRKLVRVFNHTDIMTLWAVYYVFIMIHFSQVIFEKPLILSLLMFYFYLRQPMYDERPLKHSIRPLNESASI